MTLRGWKERMVGHPACHLEFLRDLAEATDKIEQLTRFSTNNQENGSLNKAVANGSIE